MFTIRQILVLMRQGDRDREIAHSGLMGRKKLGVLRHQAALHDWLDPQQPLPDDGELAALQHQRKQAVPNQCVSTLKEHEERIARWSGEGIQGTTIHAALVRNHGYTGSYSAVKRALRFGVVFQQFDVQAIQAAGGPDVKGFKEGVGELCGVKGPLREVGDGLFDFYGVLMGVNSSCTLPRVDDGHACRFIGRCVA